MRSLFLFFSSVRLTVILLAFSVALIFFGTLDQVHFGIRHTQRLYFESIFAYWHWPQQWGGPEWLQKIPLPLPGGYLLGPLLLINLCCAHFRYFKPSWRKVGIALIHAGVVLLLVGQLATQVFQKEYFMWIDEGGRSNYLESFTENELVLIDKSDPDQNTVYSIPVSRFDERDEAEALEIDGLPFRLNVKGFAPNAAIAPREELNPAQAQRAVMPYNRGIGEERDLVISPREPVFAQNSHNVATAVVQLIGDQGPFGTWLVANIFRARQFNGVVAPFMWPPQTFEYQGKTWEIALRMKRHYLPSYLELKDFSHDKYPGTEIPRNFSSLVRIYNPDTGEDHEALIYMNHPLRYAGFTFYQASFANQDTASMFQVVSNPARWMPYAASAIISLGLLWQFGYSLSRFTRRHTK